MSFNDLDRKFIYHALDLARHAGRQGEIPIGAVLVSEGQIIGEGWNCPIKSQDPTSHAEIIALRKGALNKQNYRLPDTTLYVTLEPCIMCAGAILHARIKRLVFGAYDLKYGAVKSAFHLFDDPFLNHKVHWEGGLLAELCGQLLTSFFKSKR